jgi:hypothetical protein
MVWQTYDYYLEPTAAYFGWKKACEPLHVQYDPVRKTVELVNLATGRHERLTGGPGHSACGQVAARVVGGDRHRRRQTLSPLSIDLPATEACLLRLSLETAGAVVSENTYVESASPEGWSLGPSAAGHVEAARPLAVAGDEQVCRLTLTNTSAPGPHGASEPERCDGEQILPVVYSDNYFPSCPASKRPSRCLSAPRTVVALLPTSRSKASPLTRRFVRGVDHLTPSLQVTASNPHNPEASNTAFGFC